MLEGILAKGESVQVAHGHGNSLIAGRVAFQDGMDDELTAAGVDESDETLMRRVQADDAEAFEQLYDRHAARAFRVARSVCDSTGRAEDAVQEGFLSVWRSRTNYRPESGSFQGWSMTIIRNRAIDAMRSEATRRRNTGDDDGEHLASGHATEARALEDHVVARSEGDALRAALLRLPEAQAEVIALAYYGELSHTEIAKQLCLPPGTVKGRMRLGLEKLRLHVDRGGSG